MAKVIVKFERKGKLHCDACGHDDQHDSQFTAALIGTPCPVCNANMMTAADYATTEKLYRFFDGLNRWLGPILGKEESTANGERISARIHGDDIHIRRNVKKD